MKNKFYTLCTVILTLICTNLNAQKTIKGQCIDSTLQESMIGIDIFIINSTNNDTLLLSSTDEDGQFLIQTDETNFHVVFSYLGYDIVTIDSIKSQTGISDLGKIYMQPSATESYDEVVIRTTKDNASIHNLYNMQKLSPVSSNGISADIISKSPDRNTGEILKRISGASVQDNKFVIVRGMTERYNLSTIDGATLPSTEMNKKAFSFDLIPTFAVDQIVVLKAGTAQLPSEFAGGLVQITTQSIPNNSFTKIQLGSNFNSVSTGKKFNTQSHTISDFLSFGKNARNLPSDFLSYQEMKDLSKFHPNNIKKNIPLIHSLNNDFTHTTRKALPGINAQISHGYRYVNDHGNTLGFITGATFSHDETIRPDVLRLYDNFSYVDQVYQYKSSLSALFNAGYQSDKNSIAWNNIFYNSFEDTYLERDGINWGNSSEIKYYAFDLQQKLFLKSGLNWIHKNSDSSWKVETNISSAYVNNAQPDQKKLNYSRRLGASSDPYSATLNTIGKYNNRLYAQVKEVINTASVDLTLPTEWLHNSTFKFGLSEVFRHRDLNNRYLGLILNDSKDISPEILQAPKHDLFNPNNIDEGYYKLIDQTSDADFYTAQTYNSSAYAMIDYNYKKNRITAGLRFEHYGLNFNTPYSDDDFTKSWMTLLPSVNWNHFISEKSTSRLGYFMSTIRPEIRELAPLGFYDYELNAMVTGNPHLKPTTIHNFDYKWEFYPSTSEILSIGVFYKHFVNTIENKVYTSNSSYDITPQNFNKAQNMGLELEVRQNLGRLTQISQLYPLSAYMNVTYTHSTTEVPDNFYILGKKQTQRALSGQSPWIINAGLFYTHPSNMYSASILYNYIDKNIYMLGHDRIGHVYLDKRHVMDLQLSYTPIKDLVLKLNVKDLFSAPITFFIDQDNDGQLSNPSRNMSESVNIYKDWIWQEYRPGTTLGLTIQYNIN